MQFFQSVAKLLLEELIKVNLAKAFASSSIDNGAVSLAAAAGGLPAAATGLSASTQPWFVVIAGLKASAQALALAATAASAGKAASVLLSGKA